MRFILILAIFGMLLILPGLGSAETTEDCQTRCASEKAASEVNCPPPGGDTVLARAQCLREILDTFSNCLNTCPQPAPTDTPAEK
jgi:hypothetical protein